MANTPITPHVPGSLPANATTVGFDYNNPLNQQIVNSYQETIQIIDQCRSVAHDEVTAVDEGIALLSTVNARGLTLLVNLPPLPLQGLNAGLTMPNLANFLAFWQASLTWMSSPQTITVPVAVPNSDGSYNLNSDGTLVTTNLSVTDTPLNVFRRVMSNPSN